MTSSASGTADREAEWIVCLGETRIAVAGVVSCPRREGAAVPIDGCWACHLLAWRRDERALAEPCTMGPENSR